MHEKWQRGFGILGGAILLGVLSDALLRPMPGGINVFLWICALVGLMAGISHFCKLPLMGGGRWLMIVILGFAAAIAWRDSETLRLWNMLAICGAMALVMVRGRSGQVRTLGIIQTFLCGALMALNMCVGSVLLAYCDLPWRTAASEGKWRRSAAVARGILLAIPLLAIFGALFVAADARFARLVSNLWRFDPAALLEHAMVIGVCAWAAAGLIRGTLMREDDTLMAANRPDWLAIGSTEIAIMLGALNGLFLLFVCTQATHFFGGQAHVIATAGLTAADYARRGFFELVTVAGLVLPLLLASQALLRDEDGRAQRWFRSLASLLVLLTFLVMGSAVQRMTLYYIGFGLTELRFYVSAFMVFLAAVFLWYAVTVLRGQRTGFCFGTLAIGFATLALLDFASPDAIIVRANAARLRQGRGFDAAYAASLSADATPALIEAFPSLGEADRRTLANALCARWLQPRNEDWRVWNFDRTAARSAAVRRAAMIEAYTSVPAAAP